MPCSGSRSATRSARAVEWLHPDQIRNRYGGPLRDMVASAPWELGEWTDDTAMAIALAESLADQGGYDENDVFGRYAMWARSRPKDIGATVAAALRRSRSADEARAAAEAYHEAEGRSAGNGSLMRTVPIAIRYRSDPGAIERISRLDSGLTHHDPLAGDACAWLNLTVAALIQGRQPPQSDSEVAPAAEAAITDDDAGLAAAAQEQRGFVMTTLRIAFAARVPARRVRAGGCVRRQPGRRRRHERRRHRRAGRRPLRGRRDPAAMDRAAASAQRGRERPCKPSHPCLESAGVANVTIGGFR